MNTKTKKAKSEAAEVAADTPKAETIIAYKGFDKDMKCRGFQFEVGKTYTHEGKVKACESGFHSCENPLDVFSYYDICSDNRFALVKASGEISRHSDDSKLASASLTVEAELRLPEFIATAIGWIKKLCEFSAGEIASGNYSQLAASGNSSKLAASGDSSKLAASGNSSKLAASGYSSKLAASGYSSQLAASGDSSQLAASGYSSQLAASGYSSKLAASGDSSKLAASGNYSQLAASGDSSKLAASGYSSQLAASGYSSIAACIGLHGKVKAGKLGAIALTRWIGSEKRYRISVGYVGENGIKPDVWYSLNEDGEFVEVAE